MYTRPRLPPGVESPGGDYLFDAVLYPHRSLGPRGFWLVMAMVSGVSFAAGLAFYRIGAWPVVGFFGLDAALIYGAFRLSYRAARLTEWIRLSEDELTVHRISPLGRVQNWTFPAYWARVRVENGPGQGGGVVISSHGRHVSVGSYLSDGEKRDLADALDRALGRLKEIPASGRVPGAEPAPNES